MAKSPIAVNTLLMAVKLEEVEKTSVSGERKGDWHASYGERATVPLSFFAVAAS